MLSNACPKPRPRILEKRDDKRAAEKLKREVFADVDYRDKRTCRCCGRKGNPNSATALGRIHRAHIHDASRGGSMASENLISLCSLCHCLEHAKQLFIVGTNAWQRIEFEIHEAAVVEVFAARRLPSHVRIVC